MGEEPTLSGYIRLIDGIGALLKDARLRIASAVNNTLVQTYWTIGKYIEEVVSCLPKSTDTVWIIELEPLFRNSEIRRSAGDQFL